jgi:hypothetical protein
MNRVPNDKIIHELVAGLQPVRPLRTPMVRLGIWLVLSLPWVVAVVAVHGVRPDIATQLSDTRWLVEQGAALATALMAAMAAFCAGVPGRPRWEHFMPLVPLALWLGILGQGCLQELAASGNVGEMFHQDWQCLPAIIFVGLGPAAVLTAMVRRGFPRAPMLTAGLAALASAGLAEVGLRVFHREAASLMVLVWQAGTVVGLALLAGLFGRKLLRFRYLGLPQSVAEYGDLP